MTEAWKTLAEIQVQTPHPIVKDASHVVPPKQQKAAFAPAHCPSLPAFFNKNFLLTFTHIKHFAVTPTY